MAEPEKSHKVQVLLAWINASSVIAFMVFSTLTVLEMRRTNAFTMKQQAYTLRPSIYMDHVEGSFQNIAKPEERWQLLAVVINKGQVPATGVVTAVQFDALAANHAIAKPEGEPQPRFLPDGAMVSIPASVSKREALDNLREGGGYFLHVALWYEGPDKRRYHFRAVAALAYEEGKYMRWDLIDMFSE